MGGNDEREQTLNQLLAEMDGFDPSKGVILLAATNRPEVLDKALLRRRPVRPPHHHRPAQPGGPSGQTLHVHTRNIRLAEDVDLKKIAQATAGCVGADLANLVNEAALRAVRLGRQAVNQEDLLAAVRAGHRGHREEGQRPHRVWKSSIVAYHEVGHAHGCRTSRRTREPVSEDHHRPPHPGRAGLHPADAGGGQVPSCAPAMSCWPSIAVSMGGRAAEEVVIEHHDQRRRAGHSSDATDRGPQHGRACTA